MKQNKILHNNKKIQIAHSNDRVKMIIPINLLDKQQTHEVSLSIHFTFSKSYLLFTAYFQRVKLNIKKFTMRLNITNFKIRLNPVNFR